MERRLTDILETFQIKNSVRQLTQGKHFYQITFTVECDIRPELILSMLNEWGIGYKYESSVSMIPCTIQTTKHDPMQSE